MENDTLYYNLQIPLGEMSNSEQVNFWVIEGRIRTRNNFDTGFAISTKGAVRFWELDWSLEGKDTADQIIGRLKREGIPMHITLNVGRP